HAVLLSLSSSSLFFFNDTAPTEIYTLSLHDALPILAGDRPQDQGGGGAMTALLRLENVTKRFPVGRREITAVDSVSLEIHEGEILCMVGESGCGKTTTGKIISGLLRPTSGTVLYRGQDIWQMDRRAFSRFRKDVQVIHQDPYASLNPVRTVYKTLSAPLFRHRLVKNRKEAT